MAMRRLLNTADAAEYLGRTPKALRGMVHRRDIPFVKVGSRVFFDIRALDRWIDDHTVEAAS